MDLERLREKILEEFYPSEEERNEVKQQYQEISEFVQQEYELKTFFAGSASRGTCITGDKDVDVFVLFPEDTNRQVLEDKGLEIGKKVFENFNGDHHVEYAEHPYTKGDIDGLEVEIVPCYDVPPEDIKSAVDRTPHHSKWVEENLSEEQRKDVVMLKVFLETAGIYGSSLKVRGFSGYLCEILVSEYGSFYELLQEAVNWSETQVIDPENHYEEDLPSELRKKFKQESLRVIDPVDPERNVASVLTEENYARFIHLAWKFRQNPGIDFFTEKEPSYTDFELKQEIQGRGSFIVLSFPRPEGVEDIIYPQMRKTEEKFRKNLDNRDFRVHTSGFHIGDEDARIFFELDPKLPEIVEVKGPSVFHGEDHLAQFSSKYDNTFIQDDRLWAKTEREFTDVKNYLDYVISGDLDNRGIPDRVAEKITDFSYEDPFQGDDDWMNYLAEKLHLEE